MADHVKFVPTFTVRIIEDDQRGRKILQIDGIPDRAKFEEFRRVEDHGANDDPDNVIPEGRT